MAGQRLSRLQMDELRNTLDTDAEEPSPDEDLSTELRGIKLTDDNNEPNVSATVGVQDRIRFSHHLGKVKLQDPARPRLNPVNAGRPSPKKKKSPGPKSPDRMRTMMLAASFRSAKRRILMIPRLAQKQFVLFGLIKLCFVVSGSPPKEGKNRRCSLKTSPKHSK